MAAAKTKKKTASAKSTAAKKTVAKKKVTKKAAAPAKKKAPAKKAASKKAAPKKAVPKKAAPKKPAPKKRATAAKAPPAKPEEQDPSSGIPHRPAGTPGFGIPPTYLLALPEYEKGIELLQQREFTQAEAQFEKLLAGFPEIKNLVDRARIYIALCQKQRKQAPELEGFDDFYNHGVYLSNRGDYTEALQHLSKALEFEPQSPKVHYSIASVLCLQGEREPSLDALRISIELDESIRIYAKNDPDFQRLQGDPDFNQLVGLTEAQSAG